jgi:hypothetical protein
MAGHSIEGREHVDLAMRLSPLDPLHYAMLATRGFTHMLDGDDAEAARWAERGARSRVRMCDAVIAAAAVVGRRRGRPGPQRAKPAALTRADFSRVPDQSDPMRSRLERGLGLVGF